MTLTATKPAYINETNPMVPQQYWPSDALYYPDSDGEPMAENTQQFDWISIFKHNLDILFRQNPDVFVAADLFWYPVEGDNTKRTAPDVMVALGRPKGDRGSYMQWLEGGQPPQVVFEVLSPGNRFGEMLRKLAWYEEHGVEEYYVYNPDTFDFTGFLRIGNRLLPVANLDGFVSPLLGIRFETPVNAPLIVRYPDGRPFTLPLQIASERDEAVQERDEAIQERDEAVQERDTLREQAEKLRATLRSLGIDPDAM